MLLIIALRSVLRFLSTYLFLWGHEVAYSLRLLRLQRYFLQISMNFSKSLSYVVVRLAFSEDFPCYIERFLGIFQFPYMFWQFGAVSFIDVSEGCCMISESFFEVCCESYV